MCVVIHAAKIIHKKVKCKLLEVKLQSCLFFLLRALHARLVQQQWALRLKLIKKSLVLKIIISWNKT